MYVYKHCVYTQNILHLNIPTEADIVDLEIFYVTNTNGNNG